jgi:hypothetical protein
MEKQIMTKLKTACAAMLASMLIAAPAFAQDAMMFGNRTAYDSYANMGPTHHGRVVSRTSGEAAAPAYGFDGSVCVRAPRVGAFATQPWDTQAPCEPSY